MPMLTKNLALLAAALTTTATLGLGTVHAQQNQNEKKAVAGEAQVRTLEGPEIDVKGDKPAQMVAMFPQADGEAMKGLQIVLVEMEMPAQQQGGDQANQQQNNQQQEPRATGREIVFSADDAVNGLAAFQLDKGNTDRRYKVIARLDGRDVNVQQSRSGQGMTVLTVTAKPSAEQTKKYEEQVAQYQERQQQQQQQAQADQNNQGDNQGNEGEQTDQAQPAGGNVGEAEQAPQRPGDTEAAVLIIYSGGSSN